MPPRLIAGVTVVSVGGSQSAAPLIPLPPIPSLGARWLGFVAAVGNGGYVDLGTAINTAVAVTRVTAFAPAAWQMLVAAQNGSFPVRQFGEVGQHTSDVYGGCSSTTVTATAFPQSGVGAGKGSLTATFAASTLATLVSAGTQLVLVETYSGTTARLAWIRRDTGAVLAQDSTTMTTRAWQGSAGGHVYVGCVEADYGRTPARLGLLWDRTAASVLTDSQACAAPSITDASAYDFTAQTIGTIAGSLSIANLASGGPALTVTRGLIYDPATVDAAVADVVLNDDSGNPDIAGAGLVGSTRAVAITAVNAWSDPLPDTVLAGVVLTPGDGSLVGVA